MKKNTILVWILILILVYACTRNPLTSNTKTIEIKYPQGGEIINEADSLNIQWDSEGISNINIYIIYFDIGKCDTVNNIPAKNSLYSISKLTISDSCIIRIEDSDDTAIYDILNKPIKITFNSDKNKSIQLIYPQGGEYFQISDTLTIKWKSKNIKHLQILLDGPKNGGVLGYADPSLTDEFVYIIPSNKTGEFRLKITDTHDFSIYDTTSSTIGIYKEFIEILSPSVNSAFSIYDSILINWQYNIAKTTNFIISISFNNGDDWEIIRKDIPSSENQYIYINETLKTSNVCKFKIEDQNNKQHFSISENTFKIYNPSEFDASYFPLQIGNSWNWERRQYNSWENTTTISNYKITITDTVIIDNLLYYKFNSTYYRINNANGMICKKNNIASNEQNFIQLSLPVGNYIVKETTDPDFNQTLKVTLNEYELFGEIYESKSYSFHCWISGNTYRLTKNFGITFHSYYSDIDYTSESLKGCVINGTVHGDTTLTNNN